MRIARFVSGSCVVVLLAAGFGNAAGSAVADAAMRRNTTALRSLLQQKADVNVPQPDGATALHWAVQYDDVEIVQLLIRAGANVKAAAARIDVLLENGTITVAGYTRMTVHREARLRQTEVDALDPTIRWFHRGGHYRAQFSIT